ncbi:MAG TPA: hypothetical protein VHA34_09870, partial [Actinomycetes bacterium]|nr:hypothetical protein [Actinomycetes bacterium]
LGRALRGLRGAATLRLRPRQRPAPRPAAPGPTPHDGLDAAEQAALEQLGAADGYATRWPVRRAVARSLAARQLVVIAPDYVLLTEAGRRALTTGALGRD